MKKLLPILILALIIPQVAFAAWWNPLSWRKRPIEEPPHIQVTDGETVKEQILEGVDKTNAAQNKIKPVVEERVIRVADPTLQAKINTLITENVTFRARIAELEAILARYTSIEKQNETTRINQQKEKEVEERARLEKEKQASVEQAEIDAQKDARKKALNIEIAQLYADKTKLQADEDRCPRGNGLNMCSLWATIYRGLDYGEAYRRIEVRIAELRVELAGL